MNNQNTKYICVGKIVNTHGLKGEAKIYPYLNPKEDFENLENIIVEPKIATNNTKNSQQSIEFEQQLETQGRRLQIVNIRYKKNMILARFDGVDTIEEVEGMKDRSIYALKDDVAEEDGFFYSDIIGFDVVDEKLGKLGKISDVTQGVAHDIFTVLKSDGKSFMIPSVKEFVKDIDDENQVISVCIIDGMME